MPCCWTLKDFTILNSQLHSATVYPYSWLWLWWWGFQRIHVNRLLCFGVWCGTFWFDSLHLPIKTCALVLTAEFDNFGFLHFGELQSNGGGCGGCGGDGHDVGRGNDCGADWYDVFGTNGGGRGGKDSSCSGSYGRTYVSFSMEYSIDGEQLGDDGELVS